MVGKSKFGVPALDLRGDDEEAKPSLSRGPMQSAIAESGSKNVEMEEDIRNKRERMKNDAIAYREASEAGLVLRQIPLSNIVRDGLPRDRIDLEEVERSDQMEELKASIRARGQKEPIEVFLSDNQFILKKGWRRLTALMQLFDETGDERFAHAVARVDEGSSSRLDLFVEMVEENVIRENLTFAEMASVVITASQEPENELDDRKLVDRIFGSLHLSKRSNISSFVRILQALGGDLPFPKMLSRDLGLQVAKALKDGDSIVEAMRAVLRDVETPADQTKVLEAFLRDQSDAKMPRRPKKRATKVTMHVDGLKITRSGGDCRIVSADGFGGASDDKMKKAIQAFVDTLKDA